MIIAADDSGDASSARATAPRNTIHEEAVLATGFKLTRESARDMGSALEA